MLQGKKFTFDEESLALYDAVAPTKPVAEFEAVLAQLSARLPGEGSLIDRYDRYKQASSSRRPASIACSRKRSAAAAAGCRACRLPMQERFTIEYVTGKSWSGYNWYQGNFKSLIQVNTDLPIYIDRAIDLACHEGYPGHHVYNVLLEKNLVKDRGWIEYTVYPLFSPQSLIAEGTANYGIEVAFSMADRLRFESDVLFPLAGLDESKAAEYYYDPRAGRPPVVCRQRSGPAISSTARSIAMRAVAWLEKYAMYTKPRAEQRVKFIEQYRSYVINYNLGKDLIRAYVEKAMGRDKTRAAPLAASSARCCRRRACRQD